MTLEVVQDPVHVALGTVLVVEDDEVDARSLTRLLGAITGRTDQIRLAYTLGEALKTIDEEQPQVVLADLGLPDSTHLETVRALVDRLPFTPIIVQTGVYYDDLPVEALELGAQDFLIKGFITNEALRRSLRYAQARQRLVMRLTGTEAQLRRTQDELGDVASVFAQDLRGPVRTARMLGEMLTRAPIEDRARVSELQHRLDAALARVDRLILSMLDFQTLGQHLFDCRAVVIGEVLLEAFEAQQADLAATGSSYAIHCGPDTQVEGNTELLLRLFANLIVNAVKFRRPGRPAHIDVTAERQGDVVVVAMTDDGIGIDPRDRERVFRLMERAASIADGLGFGLAVGRRIVEAHHGSITIADSAGPGTTVVVKLPVLRVDDAARRGRGVNRP